VTPLFNNTRKLPLPQPLSTVSTLSDTAVDKVLVCGNHQQCKTAQLHRDL